MADALVWPEWTAGVVVTGHPSRTSAQRAHQHALRSRKRQAIEKS
jgi:hypothetical protein